MKLTFEYAYLFPSTLNSSASPFCSTKATVVSSSPANTGTLNFWNGSTHKDSSNLLPNRPILSSKHNQWLCLLFFVDNILYVGSNDSIEKQFEDSVNNCFHVKFLGPTQWCLQMRIHQHQYSTYTLNQHRYVLNTLQCYDPNSEFSERYAPFLLTTLLAKTIAQVYSF